VDDLPEKLLAIESILAELEQNVVTSLSGRDALRQLLARDFAVVLLDVNMPDLDGFETARLIRQRPRSAHTPIIFVTGFSDELLQSRGYELGAVDYILSPVVPEVLRTKVSVFVELYQKTEQVRRQAEERVALVREQAARAAAEEVTRRSVFLAEAGAVLADSLDLETTRHGLLSRAVPQLADLALVTYSEDLTTPNRAEWVRTTEAGGPSEPQRVERLEDAPLSAAAVQAVGRVLAGGKAEQTAQDGVAGAGGALVLPLRARGRTLGVLVLALAEPDRAFAPADRALAEELADRAATAVDNARLYHTLQEADRKKDEFLAMLAHELRNPLAPIRNAVRILRCRGSEHPEFRWAQEVIERQVRQMARLVDDLLDVSRITRGIIRLRQELVDLGDVVTRAVETSLPAIEARQHHLTVQVAPGPQPVAADPARLEQVLANLLNNAAKYTEPGGRIELTVERDGTDYELRVRDTGVGVSPVHLTTIFEPFTQVDKSLDRTQGGLGIGLTLVRRLVELHGGSVEARSGGPGQGSEFVVRLPQRADEELTSASGRTSTENPPRDNGTTRVLVVDDNADGAQSLATLLRLSGFRVEVAQSGPAALTTAESFQPDVVLLDIGLPGMDGYEVARRLRAEENGSRRLLVALTGYGREEDRRRSQEAGFDHHLAKPVDPEQLLRLLNEARTCYQSAAL
jgi:signal transduction histidine kinase/DNA-binding response OmpR family regulator